MTPQLFKLVSENLARHEGRKLTMYLDTVGVVTCGIGHALFTPMEAVKLSWYKEHGVLANRQDILNDWERVKARCGGSRLMMHFEETDRILEADLVRFEKVLRAELPDLDSYPEPVQVALFDIVFNCGSLKEWPRFTAAITQRKWMRAASESRRPQVSNDRNNDTHLQLAVL